MLRVGGRHTRRLTTNSVFLNTARSIRWYSTTLPKLSEAEIEDDDNDDAPPPLQPDLNPKKLATAYAQRRNAYRRAVTSLRKQYAAEYEARRATDEAAIQKQRKLLTRKRLERQRLKNIRSARNAALEEMKRLERAKEFELELEEAQKKRNAKHERFQKARKLLLAELEAECHDWLTTPAEVNAALDPPEASQELWSRPGMHIGAPPSSSEKSEEDFLQDAQFWRYECHTWETPKTFPSMKDLFLEEMEEETYLESNVDRDYWNDEEEDRARKRLELEDRAKLRAMVREEGRKVLLRKQRDWMQGRYGVGADVGMRGRRGQMHHHSNKGEIPKPMPAPKLDVLADYDAMEREGVKVLMKDPTKFFVFEDSEDGPNTLDGESGEDAGTEGGGQRTLGRPIRLRDPLRDNPLHPGSPYPILVGREPRPDTRSDREKKRAEREEKMRAAAAAAASGDGGDGGVDDEIAFAADEMAAAGGKFDYDEAYEEMDVENREWEEGLDPVADEIVLQTPRVSRLSEADVDWVIEKLEQKAEFVKEQIMMEDAATDSGQVEGGGTGGGKSKELIDKVVKAAKESSSPTASLEKRRKQFNPLDYMDEIGISDKEALAKLGLDDLVDMEALEKVLDTLTEEQRDAIGELDIGGGEGGDEGGLSRDDIAEALSKVPGLSEEQVSSLIDLELSMAENKELCKRLLEEDK